MNINIIEHRRGISAASIFYTQKAGDEYGNQSETVRSFYFAKLQNRGT